MHLPSRMAFRMATITFCVSLVVIFRAELRFSTSYSLKLRNMFSFLRSPITESCKSGLLRPWLNISARSSASSSERFMPGSVSVHRCSLGTLYLVCRLSPGSTLSSIYSPFPSGLKFSMRSIMSRTVHRSMPVSLDISVTVAPSSRAISLMI